MYCDVMLRDVRANIRGGCLLANLGRALKLVLIFFYGKTDRLWKCCNIGSVRKYLTGHKYRTE